MNDAAMRFARGDNPEQIKADMMAKQTANAAPTMNRAQRRMAKKKTKRAQSKAAGFGR